MTIDHQNPYQPPERFDRPAANANVFAGPVMAFLLTTFGGGAILLVIPVAIWSVFSGTQGLTAISEQSEHFLLLYGAWVAVPGLLSGVISSQISRQRSTNRELIAVAIFLILCLAGFGFSSGAPTPILQMIAVLMLACIFQFWFAGRLGRRFQGSEQAGESRHD